MLQVTKKLQVLGSLADFLKPESSKLSKHLLEIVKKMVESKEISIDEITHWEICQRSVKILKQL